jgi:hypothetical protein
VYFFDAESVAFGAEAKLLVVEMGFWSGCVQVTIILKAKSVLK